MKVRMTTKDCAGTISQSVLNKQPGIDIAFIVARLFIMMSRICRSKNNVFIQKSVAVI
jgi:hypothetical protein